MNELAVSATTKPMCTVSSLKSSEGIGTVRTGISGGSPSEGLKIGLQATVAYQSDCDNVINKGMKSIADKLTKGCNHMNTKSDMACSKPFGKLNLPVLKVTSGSMTPAELLKNTSKALNESGIAQSFSVKK